MNIAVFATVALLALAPTAALARGGGHGGSHSGGSHSGGSHRTSSSTSFHFVHSYTRRNGTFVQGHYQTDPNSTRNDNWSTTGNVNPFTGEQGTKPGDP